MNMSRKLVFFGNERLATAVDTRAPTLRALVHAGYDIEAVIANYTSGTSRNSRRLEIVEVAHAYHIPVLMPKQLGEITDQLRSYQAQAGVLVAYGQIIPQTIIDIFPGGIINVHPSLLPQYRGPTPIESAILDGVKETGVSLMRLVAKMDAGPLFAQEKVVLKGNETKQALADKLLRLGADSLAKNLSAILDGSLKSNPQDDTKASYSKLFTKDDGILDWGQPANILERQVRAFAGWPKSVARLYGHKIIITEARVAKDEGDGALVMRCHPGWLAIEKLIGPSGRTMTGAEFIRGYKE